MLHVGLVEVRDAAQLRRVWEVGKAAAQGGGDVGHERVLSRGRGGSCLGRRRLRSSPGLLGGAAHTLDGVKQRLLGHL